ncbi:ABC transporter ATP-binding protein [Halomicrococcus sp. NG-SE-24]|uniref:ABC transporter ATP-binding protein n=1 Tax=Halomicrococcus sp. NG-SE-24 TaxID=3436928 RepID=UPI003D98194B
MSDSHPETSIESTTQSIASQASGGQVELRDLTKIYDDGEDSVVAVDNMNVTVEDGEFLVFVGPSGCGKTTTLRSIAGLEEITDGEILIEDESVAGKAPRQRDIAMVFQTYALYPHMTVQENMAYPLKVRGVDKATRKQKVRETAELLQISELLDRQPKDLSGGQQQRVALGRALVREPRVFLFDEPLSNLDAKLRIKMRTELNRLHDKIGKTSIYVTHDQAEAMTLGDRIAVMNDAEIQQIAPPQQVYDKPANQFVAGFIGSPQMNFFDVEVHSGGGMPVIDTQSFTLPYPDWMRDRIDRSSSDGFDAVYGIRPEDISISSLRSESVSDVENAITAEVLVIEEMGSDFFLTMEKDGVEFQAIVEPETAVSQGDTVTLSFNEDKYHLFDNYGGESLVYGSQGR